MKRMTFLGVFAFIATLGMVAQEMPEGMVSLLPDGVKANIDATKKVVMQKNLVVTGSPEKGYVAFFSATDESCGEELWVTDGTAEGTRMVKDINPGAAGSDVVWLSRFQDKVVFSATDGEFGSEPWISDGTEEGTYMLKDVHEMESSSPSGFIQLNEDHFVFGAMDFESELYSDEKQSWLWISDGTEEGTERLAECSVRFPGRVNNSFNSPFVRVGRKVFFKASDIDLKYEEELWVTDGTTDGTYMVMDINTEEVAKGTAAASVDEMVNFYNEKLFFQGFSIEHGNEPWTSDGTAEGTYEIIDSDPTFTESGFPRSGSAGLVSPMPYKGYVCFRGFSAEYGRELGFTNLEKGNLTVIDVNRNEPTNTQNGYPGNGVEFDGVWMFSCATGFDATKPDNFGGELHYFDGDTVNIQSDFAPGSKSTWTKELTVVSGSLYFWAESKEIEENTQKLFRINNKEEFPVRVTNFFPEGDKIKTLRNLDGDLLFSTDAENKGLYCYHYRKDDYDAAVDSVSMEIEYRTRAEIASGIDHVSVAENSFMVYPNPTKDSFRFSSDDCVNNLKVIDITGKTALNLNQLTSNTVQVGSLASGIYKVVITTDKGVKTSSLVIK